LEKTIRSIKSGGGFVGGGGIEMQVIEQ